MGEHLSILTYIRSSILALPYLSRSNPLSLAHVNPSPLDDPDLAANFRNLLLPPLPLLLPHASSGPSGHGRLRHGHRWRRVRRRRRRRGPGGSRRRQPVRRAGAQQGVLRRRPQGRPPEVGHDGIRTDAHPQVAPGTWRRPRRSSRRSRVPIRVSISLLSRSIFGLCHSYVFDLLHGSNPIHVELSCLENELRDKEHELGEVHTEICALRLSKRVREKAVEELTYELERMDEKLKLTESHLENKPLAAVLRYLCRKGVNEGLGWRNTG